MFAENFIRQSEILGRVYEILVKRGVIACLIDRNLLRPNDSWLERWGWCESTFYRDVVGRSIKALGITDEREKSILSAYCKHLALTALGNGYCLTREYIKRVEETITHNKIYREANLSIKALWCPLTLPEPSPKEHGEEWRTKIAKEFASTFGIDFFDSAWTQKGKPANADLILWLRGESPGKSDSARDFIHVQEYSFYAAAGVDDFRNPQAHVKEILRYLRYLETKSVFTQVSAEVDHEEFRISDRIYRYFRSLTGKDKPFYKLCQASSYAYEIAELLRKKNMVGPVCHVRALAVTPYGEESLGALYDGSQRDARVLLMKQMASAYQKVPMEKSTEWSETAQHNKRILVTKAFPKVLRQNVLDLGEKREAHTIEEKINSFFKPQQEFLVDEVLSGIEENAKALDDYFGRPFQQVIKDVIEKAFAGAATLTLRDLHAASIIAGLENARKGQINVIALEGAPGIGKTTSVRRYLTRHLDNGWLFFYLSPRVVINNDVSGNLAEDDNGKTGILTLTSNEKIIKGALDLHSKGKIPSAENGRRYDGVVVADGIENLKRPAKGSILVLSREDMSEVECRGSGQSLIKRTHSENEDEMQDKRTMGVIRSLALATYYIRESNPEIKRIAITAAVQGYRTLYKGNNTLESLSRMFRNPVEGRITPAAVKERLEFAKKIPSIVIMIDEITGDPVGVNLVRDCVKWLNQEFIGCFNGDSPFTVTLIISDASLCNEIVLERYISAGAHTPDRVLVTKSRGQKPLDLAVNKVRIAGKNYETFHVMANCFPASELHTSFRSSIKEINEERLRKGVGGMSLRAAILEERRKAMLECACRAIKEAQSKGARQILYFAQDKQSLNDIQSAIGDLFDKGETAILDSSVPARIREDLMRPKKRDAIKVFLMTSSGSRGISFPKADWIIADMPHFAIESSLMEIAQLVYRGRGKYKDENGEWRPGDDKARHLVFIINDFIVRGANDDDETRAHLQEQHSINIATIVAMLRATILTRITGDAGIPNTKLAIVPVGGSQQNEVVRLMSQSISGLLQETMVYKGRCFSHEKKKVESRADSALKIGFLDNVKKQTIKIFKEFSLEGIAPKGMPTMIPADADRVTTPCSENLYAKATGGALVVHGDGTQLIADHQYFRGPVLIENWGEFISSENVFFNSYQATFKEEKDELLRGLAYIGKNEDFPYEMRNCAKDVATILARKTEASNRVHTYKAIKSPHTWIAVPATYILLTLATKGIYGDGSKICSLHNEETDHDKWRAALAAALGVGQADVLPPIAIYKIFPWAACVRFTSPLNYDVLFDDRYFGVSSEINLLNAIFLMERDGGGSPWIPSPLDMGRFRPRVINLSEQSQ